MFFSKYIVLLCLYEELEKNKQIDPKEIINKFEITALALSDIWASILLVESNLNVLVELSNVYPSPK